MNEIYDIYRKIRTDCTTHLEVQDKMIKDYGYTWQEITEAKVAMESNEPNYWLDKSIPDMVNSPPHYTKGGIETIDFIQAKLSPEEYRGYIKGTMMAYVSRLGDKDSDDAGKTIWYAKRYKKL